MPRIVLVENVVGIMQNFLKHGAKAPLSELCIALEAMGYVPQPMQLNAMDFGVPQHRPRVFIVALRRELAMLWGLVMTQRLWRSDEECCQPLLAPEPTRGKQVSVGGAMGSGRLRIFSSTR